jgi:hypothetical protein
LACAPSSLILAKHFTPISKALSIMDIERNSGHDIYLYLLRGNTLLVEVCGDIDLSKALLFYIEHLECMYTYRRFSGLGIAGIQLFIFYSSNLIHIIRIIYKYRYITKIGPAWRDLKWIKVATDTMPPSKEFKFTYVKSPHELPTNIYPANNT